MLSNVPLSMKFEGWMTWKENFDSLELNVQELPFLFDLCPLKRHPMLVQGLNKKLTN